MSGFGFRNGGLGRGGLRIDCLRLVGFRDKATDPRPKQRNGSGLEMVHDHCA